MLLLRSTKNSSFDGARSNPDWSGGSFRSLVSAQSLPRPILQHGDASLVRHPRKRRSERGAKTCVRHALHRRAPVRLFGSAAELSVASQKCFWRSVQLSARSSQWCASVLLSDAIARDGQGHRQPEGRYVANRREEGLLQRAVHDAERLSSARALSRRTLVELKAQNCNCRRLAGAHASGPWAQCAAHRQVENTSCIDERRIKPNSSGK